MESTLASIDLHDGATESSSPENEDTTRDRVLQLVAADGPVTTAQLARQLHLTTAAIRRHLSVLEGTGRISVHDPVASSASAAGPARRGRPARRYVVTDRGQASLSNVYPEIAGQALRLLAEIAGPQAITEFAARRVADLERRHAPELASGAPDLMSRVRALAVGLTADGYAATARPVPGMSTVQLCQGHCPVQQVASEFPALCDAEAQAFSRLLGVHVQRLSTLANGGHVCTTNIPIGTSLAPAEGSR